MYFHDMPNWEAAGLIYGHYYPTQNDRIQKAYEVIFEDAKATAIEVFSKRLQSIRDMTFEKFSRYQHVDKRFSTEEESNRNMAGWLIRYLQWLPKDRRRAALDSITQMVTEYFVERES